MDVTILIVSYNGREFLHRCLRSVYEHTSGIEFEVYVVDNASQDGTPEMVMSEFSDVTLMRRPTNAGFARAVNEGLALARGDAVLLVNPDSELMDNILPGMLAYLHDHGDIGILAPKLLNSDGSLQLSCRGFPSLTTALFNRYSLLTRLFPKNRASAKYLMSDFDHSSVADVDWASGACWLMPGQTYLKVGPLDEGYFWAVEDVDYCQRVHRVGLRVVYYPEASVRHHIGGSSVTLPNRTIVERHRGMWRYYRNYLRPEGRFSRPAADVLVRTGILTRATAQLVSRNLRRGLQRLRQ